MEIYHILMSYVYPCLNDLVLFSFYVNFDVKQNVCGRVPQILRVGKSIELIMASFQLLSELDKVLINCLVRFCFNIFF